MSPTYVTYNGQQPAYVYTLPTGTVVGGAPTGTVNSGKPGTATNVPSPAFYYVPQMQQQTQQGPSPPAYAPRKQ